MAFTGQLGRADSKLGNIELGIGSVLGSNFDNSVTIAGTSALAGVPATSWFVTATIDGTSACSSPGGILYAKTLSVDGTASFVGLDGFRYQLTESIDASAAVTLVDSLGINGSISIDGTSSVTVVIESFQGLLLTISGTASLTIAEILNKFFSLTISGTSAISSPGGILVTGMLGLEVTSGISILDGFLYTDSFSIDGTSEASVDFIYLLQQTLSIDGTSAIDFASQYDTRPTVTIAGTSHIDLVPTGVWYESVGVFGTSRIFIENIYDVLLVNAVIAGFSATVTKTAPGDENPAATGNFSATAQCVFNRPTVQALILVQTLVVKKPTCFSTQSLIFSQQAICHKTHVESVTQTLSMTQTALAVRAINQTLSLTHSATCTRVQHRAVVQGLSLSQSLARTLTISRSLSHTLVYNPPNLQKLPITGSQNQGISRQFEYYVPGVYSVLVPRQCLIILGVPSQTILLPCPIWGDSQAYQGEISLKRSMTGVTYTYVKKVQTQKLHYSFELWTNKYLELRQFFISHAEEVILLQNHNAETWLVRLVNNPIEFTAEGRWQPKGEKYTVTLEFEGVKIGG